jgi:beta-glucanase (GH16 family)
VKIRHILGSLVIVMGLLSGLSINYSSAQSAYSFSDEFNGTSVDTSLWSVMNQHGDTSNSEPECYLTGNTAETGGVLSETVEVRMVTCPDGTGTSSYPSGAVQMKSFNFTYGTVDVRAKVAGGTGPWPAIWLLGSNCQQPTWLSNNCPWPQPGSDEIDIAEFKYSSYTTDNQNSITGGSGWQICTPTISDASQNWHVYTLVWAPGSLTFKVDGTTTCTMTSNIPSHPMFLILNTAIGGTGGGGINNSTLPQTSLFDYVHITAQNTSTPSQTATATATQTFTPIASQTVVGPSCPCHIWSNSATPQNVSDTDPNSVELGVKLKSDVNGLISGIRFYKGSTNTGTHVGSLWTSSGTLLARATFINESSTGWQQVSFATPVAISANTVYVASYHTNVGHYAGDNNYFLGAGVDNAPLHALRDGVSGGDGVYAYGSTSTFPSNTWQSSNYWVDVALTLSNFTPTPTLLPTTTRTATPTGTSTSTQTSTAAVTVTPTPTDTLTPISTFTPTETPTQTSTATPTDTAFPTSTPTGTNTAGPTSTPTSRAVDLVPGQSLIINCPTSLVLIGNTVSCLGPN